MLQSRSKQLYFGAICFWIVALLYIWSCAPTLIPQYGSVFSQVLSYLHFNVSPTFNSTFPYFHPNFSNYDFYCDVYASLQLTTISMLISILISAVLAYSYTITFKIFGKYVRVFKPLVDFVTKLRFMSVLGFLFVFMSTLHDADKVKIALLVFSIVPFFTLSLTTMIKRIPQEEYDLWTTLKYNRWEQLYEVVIYGKADYVLEAIGVNFAMGWIMMTLAESKAMADGGLGVLLFRADKYNELINVFATQIVIICLGMLFDYLIKRLRYKIFPYTALAENQ